MGTAPEEAIEKILVGSLQRTIDFLKYAEGKNAALLTFASAWIVAASTLMTRTDVYAVSLRASLSLGFPFLIAAGALAIISFLPVTGLKRLLVAAKLPAHEDWRSPLRSVGSA